jgi:hypothetical protein
MPLGCWPAQLFFLTLWVGLSGIQPDDRCYLLMNHEDSSYMGCLLFDNDKFCPYIAHFLENYSHRPIAQIGSLELTFTLKASAFILAPVFFLAFLTDPSYTRQ